MTREELENVLHRAGLTSPQVLEVLAAADKYATAQAAAAISLLDFMPTYLAKSRDDWNLIHGRTGTP